MMRKIWTRRRYKTGKEEKIEVSKNLFSNLLKSCVGIDKKTLCCYNVFLFDCMNEINTYVL